MPPRSYLAIAAALAVLVTASIPLTSGSSIIVWSWLFAASACILGIVGAFRAIDALCAPRWIALAFVSPVLLWAMNAFKALSYQQTHLIDMLMIGPAAHIAFLAAAAGALRLVEAISTPHAWFRFGYAILTGYTIMVCVGVISDVSGWHFTRNAHYAASARALRVAATFVAYAALIGAMVLLTKRHAIELWAGVVTSLIGCHMLYDTLRLIFTIEARTIPNVWSQPLTMFIGGSAVWRIGSLLSHREVSVQASEIRGAL